MGGDVNRRDLLLAAGGTLLAPALAPGQAQAQGGKPPEEAWPAWGRINPDLPGDRLPAPFSTPEGRRRFWMPEVPRGSPLRPLFEPIYNRTYSAFLQAQSQGFVAAFAGSALTVPGPTISLDTRSERSENWSGAYVTATQGGMFTLVYAKWTQPRPELPTNGEQDFDPTRVCRGSIWIGLDGQRSYRDSTLPQLGTAFEFKAGAWVHDAWFQWWTPNAEDDPLAQPQPIPNLPIQQDDIITCCLSIPNPDQSVAGGRDRANCFMIRERAGEAVIVMPFEIFAPSLTKPADPPVYPRVSGATAQWIVERPKEIDVDATEGRHRPVLLPDYGTVEFLDCQAGLAEAPGATAFDTRRPETGRFISMYARRAQPRRTTIISAVDRTGNVTDSFTLRYGRGAG